MDFFFTDAEHAGYYHREYGTVGADQLTMGCEVRDKAATFCT